MNFQFAVLEDLPQIMKIVKENVADMNKQGNYQWGEVYPLESDFKKDIETQTLFTLKEGNQVLGVICMNKEENVAYKTINWTDGNFVVLHRLVVDQSAKNKGIGSNFIKFCCQHCKENNIKVIRTDTCSVNLKVNKMLQKLQFIFKGVVHFYQKPEDYNCYEYVVK